jgi:hypothetical protein
MCTGTANDSDMKIESLHLLLANYHHILLLRLRSREYLPMPRERFLFVWNLPSL